MAVDGMLMRLDSEIRKMLGGNSEITSQITIQAISRHSLNFAQFAIQE